jgi:integrase
VSASHPQTKPSACSRRCRPATGRYAGELQALTWECVDLATGVIRVERSVDRRSKTCVSPTSRAGRRRVPILAMLRDVLLELRRNWPGERLVFPGLTIEYVDLRSLATRAQATFQSARLEPIGVHECRHTFASPMIAAGVNATARRPYVGHANIATTFDLYGELMQGGESEAAALADAYLERANTRGRLAALDGPTATDSASG